MWRPLQQEEVMGRVERRDVAASTNWEVGCTGATDREGEQSHVQCQKRNGRKEIPATQTDSTYVPHTGGGVGTQGGTEKDHDFL